MLVCVRNQCSGSRRMTYSAAAPPWWISFGSTLLPVLMLMCKILTRKNVNFGWTWCLGTRKFQISYIGGWGVRHNWECNIFKKVQYCVRRVRAKIMHRFVSMRYMRHFDSSQGEGKQCKLEDRLVYQWWLVGSQWRPKAHFSAQSSR